MTDRDEVPPWHTYCGCYGCRAGDAIARRFCDRPDTTPDVHHDHHGQPSCFECCDTCTPGQGT